VAEDVALSANLPKVAPPEVVERYKEMLAAEAGTLGGDVQRQGDKVTR